MYCYFTASAKSNRDLLLIEFEVRTISYEPSFFPFAYGPSTKRAGINQWEKNKDP